MTDWCVWRIGSYLEARYLVDETAVYEQHYAAEHLVRKNLTHRQAWVLAEYFDHGVPIYCQDLLPEDGQRVRFWVNDVAGPDFAACGSFSDDYFGCDLAGFYWSPELKAGAPHVYAWEPEPPVPPLPESGK